MPEYHAVFGGTRALHELATHSGRVRAAECMLHANTAGEAAGEPACIARMGRLQKKSFVIHAPGEGVASP